MAVNTLSQLDAAAKQLYKDANYNEDLLVDRVAFGLMPKDPSWGGAASVDQTGSAAGRGMPMVLRYGRTGGASRTFADAQTVAQNKQMSVEAFQFKHVNDYGIFEVDGETLDIYRGGDMSFISALKMAMDDAAETLSDKMETFMYRPGDGSKAKISSVATDVLTMTNPHDVLNFELNELIDVTNGQSGLTISANEGAGAAAKRTRSGTIANHKVTAIDLDAGTVTVSSAAGFSPTAGDYVGGLGDLQDGESYAVKLDGFAAWCPDDLTTEELSLRIGTSTDKFRGVDRSKSYKLYGAYYDHSDKSIVSALVRAQASVGERGAAPSVAIMPHDQYRALNESLDAKREYTDVNAMGSRGLIANINYGGVFVHGIRGALKAVPALHAPAKRAWLIKPEDWMLYSAGPAISMQDRDGLSILRKATSDDYEGRFVFRGNLVCRMPGRQAQVKLAAV